LRVGLQFNDLYDFHRGVTHENTLDYHKLSETHLVNVHFINVVIICVSELVLLLLLDFNDSVVCALLGSFKGQQVRFCDLQVAARGKRVHHSESSVWIVDCTLLVLS